MSALLQQAVTCIQHGLFSDARHFCAQALEEGSSTPDLLWHVDGVAALHLKLYRDALASLQKALPLQQSPIEQGSVYNDLGLAYLEMGENDQAVQALRLAVELLPDHVEPKSNLGNALHQHGNYVEAEDLLRAVVADSPDNAVAWYNLALVALDSGRPQQALDALDKAELYGDPSMGEKLMTVKATALFRLRRLSDAESAARKRLELAPQSADAWQMLGQILLADDRADQALPAFRKAIFWEPNNAQHPSNQSVALFNLGDHFGAVVAADTALTLAPNNPAARMNRSAGLLALGDYRQGFQDWESRWEIEKFRKYRPAAAAEWNGQPLAAGQTLLVRGEQAFGDFLMMGRLLPSVIAQAAPGRVVLETHAVLAPLFRSLSGLAEVVTFEQDWPEHQAQCPLMSLPRLLDLRPSTVPSPEYLPRSWWAQQPTPQGFVPPEGSGPLIGLTWSGRPTPRNRSIDLSRLLTAIDAGLGGAPARLLSLQVDLPSGLSTQDFPQVTFAPQPVDFAESAALMARVDLLITIDSAPLHLAGALGIPTWALLVYGADWRYGRTCDPASPWYPRARLFRQGAPRRWDDALAGIEAALKDMTLRHVA